MKDKAHHLKHLQRKVIQDVKRNQVEAKSESKTESRTEPEYIKVTVANESVSAPRGVDRTTRYRNRSHQGYH